ncbi:ArsR/SmtB family transcription factor [Vaginisenegalia massiliensis]|uniref:ArsR/SmtB family transcription factor n=1 Tax=Vaginisenegalia massiliensis TaxID=2058294 RepID=UPI000F5477EC|nr:metalloregulator ArsR/SmtB family transcription factor [Vaginisenegalia massiliensis]
MNQPNLPNERLKCVKDQMPDPAFLEKMVNFFKTISHETRMKLISILAIEEMCVSDLTILMEMNQSAVSHQLKLLKEQELVTCRREGKEIYYSLKDHHVLNMYRQAYSHLDESIEYFI